MFTYSTRYAVRYTRDGDERSRDVYLRNSRDTSYLFTSLEEAQAALRDLSRNSECRQNSARVEEKFVVQHADGRMFVVRGPYLRRSKSQAHVTVVFDGANAVVTYTQPLTSVAVWDGAGDVPDTLHVFVQAGKSYYVVDKYWSTI